jgi:hypothetical protein
VIGVIIIKRRIRICHGDFIAEKALLGGGGGGGGGFYRGGGGDEGNEGEFHLVVFVFFIYFNQGMENLCLRMHYTCLFLDSLSKFMSL